jgi:DNA excision repair protein ERCC-3
VREDGHEEDVFSLIGPKRYDVPWKSLEKQGWIAPAVCHEIRVPMQEKDRLHYATATWRSKYRVASENPVKFNVIDRLIARHANDNILVIGQYLDQLNEIARRLKAPIITGSTPNDVRQELYDAFRKGELKLLVVSKVANFAIDLPTPMSLSRYRVRSARGRRRPSVSGGFCGPSRMAPRRIFIRL